jgi:hypothetical protein
VAAVHSVDVDRWCQSFDELMSRIGARFGRIEPRRRAGRFCWSAIVRRVLPSARSSCSVSGIWISWVEVLVGGPPCQSVPGYDGPLFWDTEIKAAKGDQSTPALRARAQKLRVSNHPIPGAYRLVAAKAEKVANAPCRHRSPVSRCRCCT